MTQLAFWRERGLDFSERDKTLLALLRPHIYQALVDAETRRRNSVELTPRQRELLSLVAAGYANSHIATRLGVSAGAVRKHLENIYARLHVSNRVAAVSRAFPDWAGG